MSIKQKVLKKLSETFGPVGPVGPMLPVDIIGAVVKWISDSTEEMTFGKTYTVSKMEKTNDGRELYHLVNNKDVINAYDSNNFKIIN